MSAPDPWTVPGPQRPADAWTVDGPLRAAAARTGGTTERAGAAGASSLIGSASADVTPDGIPAAHDHHHDHAEMGRARRLAALAGATALTGYVYLLDPDKGGAYPLCPSRTLLGVDCPMCGGLRGTNALLHGRVGEALDHNLLLPGILGVLAVLFGFWLLPLIGRPARRPPIPRWLGAAGLTVLVAFGVARNLPIDSLSYLGSGT